MKTASELATVHPLCRRLRLERLDRDWTLREVGDRSGFSLQQIGVWEIGSAMPSLANFERWAAAFDLTVDLGSDRKADEA